MYGVRILEVDPERRHTKIQVLVVYYDTESHTHAPLPNDEPGIFLHFLWESAKGYLDDGDPRKGPIGEVLTTDDILNYEWVDTNARRFISRVRRVMTLNDPPTDQQWEGLNDFYYERDGAWKDEHLLIQAEYDIQVTDHTWLEHLSTGDAWGSAAFPLNADTWTAEDAPHIPDLTRPVTTLRPFETVTGDIGYDNIESMEFSDDGAYLAICSDKGRLWLYDTADWSQITYHPHTGDWTVPVMMWVPGRRVLIVKDYLSINEAGHKPQFAYDLDQRGEVEAPFQNGHRRSNDGRHHITPNGAGGYDLHGTNREPEPRAPLTEHGDPIQCHTFAADSSRLFLGTQQNLYIIDTEQHRLIDKIADASERLFKLASNPTGTYLAAAGFSRKLSYLELGRHRPQELCIWRTADRQIILGHQLRAYVDALAWSPQDGRYLAAALEPTGQRLHRGEGEIAVYRMGAGENA